MDAWLGIDASTQSLSALLVDSAGEVLGEASVRFGDDLPGYDAPDGFRENPATGEVFADPRMWLDGLDLCLERLKAAGADFPRVAGVSGAGQQHGTVYLGGRWFEAVAVSPDADRLAEAIGPALSRPVSPIWMDVSTGGECAEIARALGGPLEVCRRSGSVPVERFSGPQIRRFHKTAPEAYRETARIHLVSSFLASVLAGRDAPIDHGDGAGMNLLDLDGLDWDPDLLAATAPGLAAKLPAPAPPETVVGTVVPYFQKRYGFRPDTPVVAFTGDNPSSLVGMGAAAAGTAVVSLGTSDTYFAAMDRPVTDPEGFGHVFGNPLGGFMSLVCFRNGSLAREKVRDRLGGDWSVFEPAGLAATPPGNHGNGMVPFFGPEITPRIDAAGPVLFGSASFRERPAPPALARACLEGQFLNMRRQTRWIGGPPERILLTGGASANDGIAQTIADVFGVPVERLKATGSVAVGATIRAARATGADTRTMEETLCSPDPVSRKTPVEGAAPAYRELEAALAAEIDRLRAPRHTSARSTGSPAANA